MQMGRMINKHGTMYVTRKKREVSNDQKLGTSFYFNSIYANDWSDQPACIIINLKFQITSESRYMGLFHHPTL